jgi:hypothetical protein
MRKFEKYLTDDLYFEMKATADFICDSNDNDGVAKWIRENVL